MSNQDQFKRIASIAVLDLETSNLPALNFNKVSITELCIYGFSANELTRQYKQRTIPPLPRVVHKLSLLFNPRRLIHPEAEAITGLNNYMLEYESAFDDNAAETIVGFLKHLTQPICLVAHNGFYFDYPILKQAINKTNIILPGDILCLDSLHAFREIDKMKTISPPVDLCPYKLIDTAEENAIMTKEPSTLETALSTVEEKNWSAINETTPKRSITASAINGKRMKVNNVEENEVNSPAVSSIEQTPRARRALFSDPQSKFISTKGFARRGMYKLGEIYERIFDEVPKQTHFAECDVEILTKLLLYYGEDFLDYAIEKAIPFAEVVPLGTK